MNENPEYQSKNTREIILSLINTFYIHSIVISLKTISLSCNYMQQP